MFCLNLQEELSKDQKDTALETSPTLLEVFSLNGTNRGSSDKFFLQNTSKHARFQT